MVFKRWVVPLGLIAFGASLAVLAFRHIQVHWVLNRLLLLGLFLVASGGGLFTAHTIHPKTEKGQRNRSVAFFSTICVAFLFAAMIVLSTFGTMVWGIWEGANNPVQETPTKAAVPDL